MDIEKLKKEIEKNLSKAKGERQSKIDEINKSYDAKILKLETERKTKLANVPGNEEDIKKLQQALVALGGSDDSSPSSGKTEGERVPFPNKTIEVPASYETAKTWKAKIVFALSKIGDGTNDDVLRKLAELDKGFSYDASAKTVNLTLSVLKGDGSILKTGKNGKKDIYKLA